MSAEKQKYLTAEEASLLLDEGKMTPMDLVEQAIAVTEEKQPEINAYITFTPQKARKDARQVYEQMQREGRWSPLTGIPFAVKDLIFAKGLPATAGSRQMKDFIPDFDAPVVKAMKDAGAILMGKTNTQEWGCGPTGEQSYFGPVHNPWSNGRISGGSSSGSAAAVASGMVPVALGSDAGGSIRIPASLCGCVGFKPSFELLSSEGSFRGSLHLGVEGPMAGCVTDIAMMMDVLTSSKNQPYLAAVKNPGTIQGKRIAVPRNLFMDCAAPEVLGVFEEAVQKLKTAGAVVTDQNVTMLEAIPELSSAITFPEIAYLHRERLLQDPDGYQSAIKARIERGFDYPAVKYIEAMQTRQQLIQKWAAFMQEYDALLMPTEPITAQPLFTEKIELSGGRMEDHSALLVKHTRASNVIGCPSISIPAGFTAPLPDAPCGLPVGIMLMGAFNEDAKLLALSRLTEKELSR